MVAFAFTDNEARELLERKALARKILTSPLPLRRQASVLSAPAVPGSVDRRPVAASRDPCPFCETRGDLGCAHQRPYEPPDPVEHPALDGRRPERFTAEEEQRLVRLLAQGLTQVQIGQALGRATSSIASTVSRLRREGRL